MAKHQQRDRKIDEDLADLPQTDGELGRALQAALNRTMGALPYTLITEARATIAVLQNGPGEFDAPDVLTKRRALAHAFLLVLGLLSRPEMTGGQP